MTENLSETTDAVLAQEIEATWRQVLRMPPEVDNATFFDLQGQSMAAVRLVGRIRRNHGIDVDVTVLFEDPDMKSFVREVVARRGVEAA